MEKYDYVISLGYNCDVANGLMHGELRDKSYPFDWNFTKMSKINTTIRENFINFFKRENLARSKYNGRPAMDKDGGVIYVHNGSYEDLIKNEEYYNIRNENYMRRIERFLELLNSDKKILFVRLIEDDTHEEHLEFINIIKEMYQNCNFKLILLLQDEKTQFFQYKNIYFENMKYVSGMKTNRYCISGYLRENFDLPINKQLEKHYY